MNSNNGDLRIFLKDVKNEQEWYFSTMLPEIT